MPPADSRYHVLLLKTSTLVAAWLNQKALVVITLLVIIDSVGYDIGMLMVFEKHGVVCPPTTVQYLVHRNGRWEYCKEYNQQSDVKNVGIPPRNRTSEMISIKRLLMQKWRHDLYPQCWFDEIMNTMGTEALDENNGQNILATTSVPVNSDTSSGRKIIQSHRTRCRTSLD